MSLDGFSGSELQAVGSQLSGDASQYTNREDVEIQWAMKAYHHAETYCNLISSVDPTVLKLTKVDDEIYNHFRKDYPNFNVELLDEDNMKTPEAKAQWRAFCEEYKDKVEDYNMGTLIRINSKEDFSEQNSTLVVRIQFLAIEIARNREGFNSGLKKKHTAS